MAVLIIAGCVGQTAPAAGGQSAGGGPVVTQTPEAKAVSVTITEGPTNVQVGKLFTVKWHAIGPSGSATNDTSIYYDAVSHAGTFASGVTPKTSGYKSFTPAQTGTLPADFSADIAPGSAGSTMFYRAYAQVDGLHYWSDEYQLKEVVAAPTVTITAAPADATGASSVSVAWKVEGGLPGSIGSTYLEWGILSGQYTSQTTAQTGTSPMTFSTTLTAPSAPNTIYFRVHATVDGKELITDEKYILVK
jgi:hypothetical protein